MEDQSYLNHTHTRPPFVLDSTSARSRMREYDRLHDPGLRDYYSPMWRRRLLVKAGIHTMQTQLPLLSPLKPRRKAESSATGRCKSVVRPTKAAVTHEELEALIARYRAA